MKNMYIEKRYGKNLTEKIQANITTYTFKQIHYYLQMYLKTLDIRVQKYVQSTCLDDLLKFNEEFIKNCDKNSDKGFLYEVDVEYPRTLQMLHSDLPFLLERRKRK